MAKSEIRKSTELLKLENPEATAECHLAKLVCLKNRKLNARCGGKLKTHRMQASCVLDRVKDFLPDLERANEELKTAIEDRGQNELDIENVEHADSVIEMNVALVQRDELSEDDDSSCESNDSDSSREHSSKCEKKVNIETLSSSTMEVIQRDEDEQRSKGSTDELHAASK